LQKEKDTIAVMMKIYCHAHHKCFKNLCEQCDALKKYADKKLDNCVFGDAKPACSKCQVHCYSPDQRDLILKVMRFAGPKMISKHPILAIRHIFNAFKK